MKKCIVAFASVLTVITLLTQSVYASDPRRNVYCKNPQGQKRVALTFDDGPHPRYTERILEILDEFGITATFFVIGVNAENYPEALNKIVSSGCEIANHTYSHVRIDKMSEAELYSEIKKCEDVLYEKTGKRPTLFRPPEGRVPQCLPSLSVAMGYSVVLWSIDTLDWSHNPSDKISATVMKQTRGGDIILMHDYVSGVNTTCDALRIFIPKLLSEGYEFVTVSELIGA